MSFETDSKFLNKNVFSIQGTTEIGAPNDYEPAAFKTCNLWASLLIFSLTIDKELTACRISIGAKPLRFDR